MKAHNLLTVSDLDLDAEVNLEDCDNSSVILENLKLQLDPISRSIVFNEIDSDSI